MNEKETENLKKKILECIKREPKAITTICFLIEEGYYKTLLGLFELEKEGKVERFNKTKHYMLWKIKNEK